MLIFILIDVQYLHNDVFSFEKGLIHQNHTLNSHNPIKNAPSKIPFSLSLAFIYLGNPADPFYSQVTITLMTTLLPNQVTFIFPSREIVTASENRICLFSFLQESFYFRIDFWFVKILHKILNFSTQGGNFLYR